MRRGAVVLGSPTAPPIGIPAQRYAGTTSFASSFTTVISPATTVAAGSLAILFAVANDTTVKVASSVTDDVGNTWTIDQQAGSRMCVASCQVATAIPSTAHITITWTTNTGTSIIAWIQQVAGLATSGAFDASATANGTTGTAGPVSTGSTGTLAVAKEIVWGFFYTGACNFTVGAGFTAAATGGQAADSWLEYQIVSANSPVAAIGSVDRAIAWRGLVVTYRGIP